MSSRKSLLFKIEKRGDKYSQKQNRFDVIDQRPYHSPTNIHLVPRESGDTIVYKYVLSPEGGITILHADSFKTTCVSRDDNRP